MRVDQTGCSKRVISGWLRSASGQKRKSSLRAYVVRCSSRSTDLLWIAPCPKSARKRLMHRSKQRRYSITSSAAISKPGGTVRPSSFAVLRFTTVSYLVGTCTGRSAGFAPRRIRST